MKDVECRSQYGNRDHGKWKMKNIEERRQYAEFRMKYEISRI
jgi:hypothetical protein